MLPTWPGADHCYTFLTRYVEELEHEQWLEEKKKKKRRKGRPIEQWTADSRSEDIRDALRKGDEEEIKAWVLQIKSEQFLKSRT